MNNKRIITKKDLFRALYSPLHLESYRGRRRIRERIQTEKDCILAFYKPLLDTPSQKESA